MTKDEATLSFMINTLMAVYPQHSEYPFETLRIIEETEGYESEKWNDYADYILRAYWMKRDIEIIAGRKIF